jgi:hypothetical protein
VPHIPGFPLLGWQLARAESTSRPAFEPAQRGQSSPCVGLEPLVAWQRPKAKRFTGFVTQQSLPRDAETEQSETDEMLNRCQAVSQPRCIAQNSKII